MIAAKHLTFVASERYHEDYEVRDRESRMRLGHVTADWNGQSWTAVSDARKQATHRTMRGAAMMLWPEPKTTKKGK